ncbi:hypothetical protein N7470_004125 [Penicillium chermesinum]|nr:hypothetical protein N7470_004125 [Penicillium chermesinum]
MPVTELALVRFKATEEPPSAAVKERLRAAQQGQSEYSKYPVTFFSQTEDSSFVYLLGGWESVEVHTNDWITSATNQRLLGVFAEDLSVEWMFHLNLDPASSAIPLEAPVVAIARFFVEPSKKAEFETTLAAGLTHLGAYIAPLTYAGGWRLDKEGEDEEYVLFTGWNSVEDHFKFAETESFKEYAKIKPLLKGSEIKHGRVEKWE